jgi:hypothetical protein
MMRTLVLDHIKNFTDLEFLLNPQNLSPAGQLLIAICKALKYHTRGE